MASATVKDHQPRRARRKQKWIFVVRSTRTQPEATDRHRQSPLRVHSNTPKNRRFAAGGSVHRPFSSGSVRTALVGCWVRSETSRGISFSFYRTCHDELRITTPPPDGKWMKLGVNPPMPCRVGKHPPPAPENWQAIEERAVEGGPLLLESAR